jgi:hypothetical protein
MITTQRRPTDGTGSRRRRCGGAERTAGAELRRASDRAQAVLAAEPAAAPRPRPVRMPRVAARQARLADAVVAQWLLEQVPRRQPGARIAA